MSEHIEDLLRQAATTVNVDPTLPVTIQRRVRSRRAGLAVVAVAGLVVLSLGVARVPTLFHRIPAASDGSNVLMRGSEHGVGWRMTLERNTHRGVSREEVCVHADGKPTCFDTTGYRFGDAAIAVGYVPSLDVLAVIVKTMPGNHDVSIDERNGPTWAALATDRSDYWFRFFEGPDVAGTIQVDTDPDIFFKIKGTKEGSETVVRVASKADTDLLPGYPGYEEKVAGGMEAGGFGVIKRTTDSRVCFHIEDHSSCRDSASSVDPFGVVMAQPLDCAPDDDCGPGNDLMLVFGELGEEVVKVGIGAPRQDKTTGSFVSVGQPYADCCFFIMQDYYGNAGDRVEIVAFDADDNIIGSTIVTALERR